VPGTAAPARLAGHEHDPVPQIDVGNLEAGQLREPQPTVQEQHDDGRVPAGREVGPGAGGDQGPQVGIRQHGCLGIAWGWCPDAGRGVLVGLALALEPAAEVPDPGEPSSGGVAGVAPADLDQPASDRDLERCASTSRGHHRRALLSRSASWAALVTAWSR
jgi:hypothetical protein